MTFRLARPFIILVREGGEGKSERTRLYIKSKKQNLGHISPLNSLNISTENIQEL